MSDMETVIRLGASITAMRAQVREAEETLSRRRMQLREMESALAALVKPEVNPTTATSATTDETPKSFQAVVKLAEREREREDRERAMAVARANLDRHMAMLQQAKDAHQREAAAAAADDARYRLTKYLNSAMKEPETFSLASVVIPRLANGRKVQGMVKDFFAANRTRTFSTPQILEAIVFMGDTVGVKVTDGAVRQALKRLFDKGYLVREREGFYTWNPTRELPDPDNESTDEDDENQ